MPTAVTPEVKFDFPSRYVTPCYVVAQGQCYKLETHSRELDMKSPSDRKILSTIYKMYYKEFENFTPGGINNRQSKVYVPISCKEISKKLNVDSDIVFGRLYYHLQEKYGYRKGDVSVPFFSLRVGNDERCVHFPLLASVLAGQEEEHSKTRWATCLSIIAIVVSLFALYYQK